jgi:hypothetical protein
MQGDSRVLRGGSSRLGEPDDRAEARKLRLYEVVWR